MNERQPWICPRCNQVNAPHVDHCDCNPGFTQSQPSPSVAPWPWSEPYRTFTWPPRTSDPMRIVWSDSTPAITTTAQ